MLVTVALCGMFALFGLAALAGIVDGRSQHSAWNRIAAARRELHEAGRTLRERELALDVREEELDARARRRHAAERRNDKRADAQDGPGPDASVA